MMSLEMFLAYLVACIAVIAVPGPTVTVIIANSIRHGARAGLLNVAGTQLGMAFYVTVLAFGLATVMAVVGEWFDVIRLIGAVYLIWLGVKLWLSQGRLATGEAKPVKGGFFLQGLFVALTNPKILLFLGAFLPQFIDPAGSYTAQIAVLGLTFIGAALVIDSSYALMSGGVGAWLSRSRVRLIERVSGTFLIGGGLWLALARR